VGRPSVLSRERVAVVALRVLDDEGLEALSVERIARELGVRGPSIYHHFASKAEILREVAHIVLGDLELRRPAPDWQSWMVGVCLRFYRRVLDHPGSAVILLEHLPEIATIPALGVTSRFLTSHGVDATVQLLVIEGTEKITWGWALLRAMETLAGVGVPDADEGLLEEALRAFMDGIKLPDGTGNGGADKANGRAAAE
jgi:TetR/AcrR family tetracycline transcriptional repressor